MFDRFTEKARRVILFARNESNTYGSSQIESEHLLLGLLRESRSLLDPPRAKPDAPEMIRRRIHQHAARQEKSDTPINPPISPECQRILDHADEEASAFGHLFIGTDHLLAGTLREEKSLAATILREQGTQLQLIRDELRNAPSGDTTRQAPAQELAYTPESRDALQFAREEAKLLGSRNIGTEHLILGVLRSNIFAAQLLAHRGLTVETLRQELLRRDAGPLA